jgi:hypothetical protein
MIMVPKTAEQRIAQAISENATIFLDHDTRTLQNFRFHLKDEIRPTVVRVHKKSESFEALSCQALLQGGAPTDNVANDTVSIIESVEHQ